MSSKETRAKGGLETCIKCLVSGTRNENGICYACTVDKERRDLLKLYAVKYPIPIPLGLRDEAANCSGDDPELFAKDTTPQLARDICRDCPLQEWCLDFGLWNDQHGTWGGLSQHERRVVKIGLRKDSYILVA